MAQELQAIKTRFTPQQLIQALGYAWVQLFNEQPKKESLAVLLSQSALETGRFQSCWNYNIGNIKSVSSDGRDYCYYACNEILKSNVAINMVANAVKDGGAAKITQSRSDGFSCIWFYPKHYACRFRAFKTLEEGCIDHLSFVKFRYKNCPALWNAIVSGNPRLYSHLLRANHYYTADETTYTNSVVSIFNEYMKTQFDLSQIPVVSDADKDRISNLIQLTVQDSTSDFMNPSASTDDTTDTQA